MTENEKIKILSDYTITVDDIAKILKISIPTVCRWRKKYGVTGRRGLKPGQHNNKITRYNTNCLTCGIMFETVPSVNSKYCSRECMHNNVEYIKMLKNIDRSYMQTSEYSNKLKKPNTPEYTRYKNKVHKLSNNIYEKNIEELNPHNHQRTLCGIDGGWQLDHKLSVRECFDRGIPPEEASSVNNLQLLPWKTNLLKR